MLNQIQKTTQSRRVNQRDDFGTAAAVSKQLSIDDEELERNVAIFSSGGGGVVCDVAVTSHS